MTIRWGILSTANINSALIGPIKQAKRSELVAVASRDLNRAKDYAVKHGIPKVHGSYDSLLADPQVDAIYIPLPNTLHADWTIKAAQAGKHVLCEKPLVTTLADFNNVEAAAKANNVTVFEAFMYLHHPQTHKALELIQAGKLGQVQLVNTWFNFYLPPERSSNIRLSADLSGGSMWDVGVYPNSLAIMMTGQEAPQRVWASQQVGESGVDVAMRAQLEFNQDVVAQISSGFRTPFREGAYVVGDEGILTIAEPWKPGLSGQDSQLVLSTRNGKEERITIPAVDPYLCEVEAMEACLLDNAAPVIPLSLSRKFLQSTLAIYDAAKSGAVVTL